MPLEVMQVPLIQEATNELIEETNEEIGKKKKHYEPTSNYERTQFLLITISFVSNME